MEMGCVGINSAGKAGKGEGEVSDFVVVNGDGCKC